jgi:hypothetical protein
MVIPVKTLEAEQVPESAGTPPDPPDCLTSTYQTESRCNHLKTRSLSLSFSKDVEREDG